MPAHRIDFKHVKEQADFSSVLAHYDIAHTGRGAARSALCPFHKDTKPSLKIELERKIFHCFGCDAKGNILDFVALIEDQPLPKAAQLLAAICGITPDAARKQRATATAPARASPPSEQHPAAPPAAPAVINPPLTFSLKLEPKHPYLDARNVRLAERDTFGLGYCDRGLMKGRICIPIHNEKGELVAYAGRWPGDAGWPDGEDRYKLPPKFQKQATLFNIHRVAGSQHVVLVEGYFSVFRLHQLNYPAAALQGWVLAETHIGLLRHAGVKFVTLLLDGDAAGRKAAAEMLPILSRNFFVRDIELVDGEQPDTLDQAILVERLGSLDA
jgi:DNA primase